MDNDENKARSGIAIKFKGSVKVMRSYDYCHFEVCLGSDQELTLTEVDDMRKKAAMLTDKAVTQYTQRKNFINGFTMMTMH